MPTMYDVKIEVSKDGETWQEVSAGTWRQPERTGHDTLQLVGEEIPYEVLTELFKTGPNGLNSGESKTQHGELTFRVSFKRAESDSTEFTAPSRHSQ